MSGTTIAVTYPGRLGDGKTVSDALHKMGIERTKATLEDVDLVVIPKVLPTQYADYTGNFPSWILSSHKNRIIKHFECSRVGSSDAKSIPTILPPLSVRLTAKATSEEETRLTELGFVVTLDLDGKPSYIHNLPTVEIVVEVGKMREKLAPHRTFFNYVGFEGIDALLRIKRLLEIVHSVHNFPYCENADKEAEILHKLEEVDVDAEESVDGDDVEMAANDKVGDKRKRVDSVDDYISKRVRTDDGFRTKRHYSGNAPVATPFPLNVKFWEDPASISKDAGFFNAYVPSLIDPTVYSLKAFLVKIYRILGDDSTSAISMLNSLTAALPKVVGSDMFKELSHMARFFMIGLNSGLVSIPIFRDSTYNGCFLWGSCVDIIYDRMSYTACTDKNMIMASIKDCAVVRTNLEEISSLTGVNVTKAKTVREVDSILRDHGWEGTRDQLTKLRDLMCSSCLSTIKYLPMTLENFRNILNLVKKGDFSIDHPMYPTVIMTSSLQEYHLSAFGSTAPSVSCHSNRTYNATSMNIPPPQLDFNGTKKEFALTFDKKALSVAAEELQVLMTSGSFSNGHGRRGNTTVSLAVPRSDRDSFLVLLRSLAPLFSGKMSAPAPKETFNTGRATIGADY